MPNDSTTKSGQEPCEIMDHETPCAATTTSQSQNEQSPENPHHGIDIDSIDFYGPPTPAVVNAGEAPMRELGLFDARTPSLALRPWWTVIDVSEEHGTSEYYAQVCYNCFKRARRYNSKAERFRDQKMEMLRELLARRSYHETKGVSRSNRADTETFTTKPLPLPWNKENIMKQWEERDGLDLLDIPGGQFMWEDRDEKRKYHRACEKMRKYSGKALDSMTKAYVWALKAGRAPSSSKIWGEQFG